MQWNKREGDRLQSSAVALNPHICCREQLTYIFWPAQAGFRTSIGAGGEPGTLMQAEGVQGAPESWRQVCCAQGAGAKAARGSRL